MSYSVLRISYPLIFLIFDIVNIVPLSESDFFVQHFLIDLGLGLSIT